MHPINAPKKPLDFNGSILVHYSNFMRLHPIYWAKACLALPGYEAAEARP
jgi:hypothetical protein